MGDDVEKRFNAVMEKLIQAPPKSNFNASSSSEGQFSRGKKRPNSSYAVGVGDLRTKSAVRLSNLWGSSSSNESSPCRPWDRGDFYSRLATFKAMLWFGKPQVISALNCARRGWINIDMDTIACEACGVRLLFSCPPSWSLQQVDKAASVFSLKLDSGHKLLCPWVDNACDEKLAHFPQMPTTILVEEYKSRCSSLVQLVALPMISPAVINFLRSTRLEEFLKVSTILESVNSTERLGTDGLRSEPKSDMSLTYYQAQRLISLCGWEPRTLPYFVNLKDQSDQFAKDNQDGHLSQLSRQNISITFFSSNEDSGASDDIQTSDSAISDPNSVVLECKICGSRVGLWVFSMVQRPLEFLRLNGYTDVNSEHIADDRSKEGISNTTFAPSTTSNVTIAGGPLPANQSYMAKISLPIVGHNLRARFSNDFEIRDVSTSESSLLVGKEKNIYLDEHGISDQMATQVSNEIDKLLHHADDIEKVDPPVENHSTSQNGDNLGSSREGGETYHQGRTTEHDGGLEVVTCNSKQAISRGDSKDDGEVEPVVAVKQGNSDNDTVDGMVEDHDILPNVDDLGSSREGVDTYHQGKTTEHDCGPEVVTCNSKQANNQGDSKDDGEVELAVAVRQGDRKDDGVVDLMVENHQILLNVEKISEETARTSALEFDPIRLHKYYCPWITSNGGSAPGWQQTLSALEHQHELSHPSMADAPPSSLINVDDPIAMVKRIFTPTRTKRKKLIHQS
ncbi:unnamed protein product [Cuscuta europaea]|uniref:C3HC-type domain-containing protein n=1 Tax=Cuscuta europaea TaxID=41803 RepID=A0A9P0Z7X6_CUSEU|nr:unnamed protein product [Cuscuta europaea]